MSLKKGNLKGETFKSVIPNPLSPDLLHTKNKYKDSLKENQPIPMVCKLKKIDKK